MDINSSAIVRVTGMVFSITGIAMIPAMLMSLYQGEFTAAFSFSVCAVPAVVAALVLRTLKKSGGAFDMRPGTAIPAAVLCLLVSSVTGALPFLLCGTAQGFVDCLFESVSGFTTTGATVIHGINTLPNGIILWRSISGWLGGLAVFVLVPGILSTTGERGLSTQSVHLTLFSDMKFHFSPSSMRKICLYYAFVTVFLLLLLLLSGLDIFSAVIRAMGTISTSGFTEHSALPPVPDSMFTNWILTVFMLIAAMNYTVFFRTRSRHWRSIIHDEEPRLFIMVFITASVLMAIGLVSSPVEARQAEISSGGTGTILEQAFFQSAAAVSTTGFHIADYTNWPTFCHFIILFLMAVGGCTASAAGGYKTLRLLIVIKLIWRNISRKIHPNAVVPLKINNTPIPNDASNPLIGHGMLYAVVVSIAVLIITFSGSDILTSVSSVISCMGNVGPAFGVAGPISDYSAFNPFAKILLSIIMIAGRLELAPLILIIPRFWKND